MESSALQRAESVSLKAELCEDLFITDKPSFGEAFVKDEPLLDDVCVKDEPRYEGVPIKAEPSCSVVCVKDESLGVSAAAAAAGLYTDHVVKDELVLGPELVERRGVRHAPTVTNLAIEVKQSRAIVFGRPLLRDCCVRLERLAVDTLLTGTRSSDRNSPRQAHGAGVQCEPNNTTVENVKGHSQGQTPQKKPKSILETYQCAHCKYATVIKPSLISHLMKHTSGKPYKCDQCTFSCSYKSLMQVHARLHTGEK